MHVVALGLPFLGVTAARTNALYITCEDEFSALNAEVQPALRNAGFAQQIAVEPEQRVVTHRSGGEGQAETWGEQFCQRGRAQVLCRGSLPTGPFRMEVKTTITTGTTSGGTMAPAP